MFAVIPSTDAMDRQTETYPDECYRIAAIYVPGVNAESIYFKW